MNKRTLVPLLGLLCALPLNRFVRAAALNPPEFDHSAFDDLLRAYVSVDGWVDYEALAVNSLKDLEGYLERLGAARLDAMSYEQKLAFWINAYNAHVLREVLRYPKMKKVSEHQELFDSVFRVAQKDVSLNDIEHRIIRGKANPTGEHGAVPGLTLEIFDPRVHFLLNCAAIDCPPLRNYAYTSKSIEEALRANSTDFVNSERALRLRDRRLRVNRLMQWYADDFKSLGGPATYLSRLLDPARRPNAEALRKKLLTRFDQADFFYDWTVNDIRNTPRRHASGSRHR